MISLETYKKYLVDFCLCAYDNTEEKREKRREELARRYPDTYLQKVIDDSYAFVKDIFTCETVQDGYCSFPVDEDDTEFLSLNLVGGHFADVIFRDNSGKTISRHIIKSIFGPQIYMDITHEEYTEILEDDLGRLDYDYYIYLQGFSKNMDDIKNEYLGKEKVYTSNQS